MDLFTLTLVSCGLTIFAMGIIIALIVIVVRFGGQGVSGFVSGLLAPFTGGNDREEEQDERVERERQIGVASREALRRRAQELEFAIAPDRANEQQQFSAQGAPQQFGGQQAGGQQPQFDPSRFGARLGNSGTPPRPTLTPSANPTYGTQQFQAPQSAQSMPSLSPSRPYQGGTGSLPATGMPPQQGFQQNPNQFPQQPLPPGAQQQGFQQNPNQFPQQPLPPGAQQQGFQQNPNQFPQQPLPPGAQQPLRPVSQQPANQFNYQPEQGFQRNPNQLPRQGFEGGVPRQGGQPNPNQQPPQQGGNLGQYRPDIRNISRPGQQQDNIGGRPRRDQRQGDEYREIYLDDGGFDDFG